MRELKFKTAFRYPFNRAKGMWNILWFLLPIIGWFALCGYTIRIVQEFTKGKFKELPKFKFANDLGLGFVMFFKAIPFVIVYAVFLLILFLINDWLRIGVDTLLRIFLIPMLTINFFKKETAGSLFEFKVVKSVFNNFGDYIMVLLKSIALGLIFLVMIIILVGLPAGVFTQNMFLADFYRRRVK